MALNHGHTLRSLWCFLSTRKASLPSLVPEEADSVMLMGADSSDGSEMCSSPAASSYTDKELRGSKQVQGVPPLKLNLAAFPNAQKKSS